MFCLLEDTVFTVLYSIDFDHGSHALLNEYLLVQ